MKCCICGKDFNGYGNNPEGAAWRDPNTAAVIQPTFKEDDVCCNNCNEKFVIPGRMYSLYNKKEGDK